MKKSFVLGLSILVLVCGLVTIGCTSLPSEPEEWDLSSLDTGRELGFLQEYQKNLILEINKMRSDPQKYAKYHRRDLDRAAYNYLQKMEPASPLIVEEGLTKSAADLLKAGLGEPNRTVNIAVISNTLETYGKYSIGASWGTAFGTGSTQLFEYLLSKPAIGEKYPYSILNPTYTHCGIAAKEYSGWSGAKMTLIIVTGKYTPK